MVKKLKLLTQNKTKASPSISDIVLLEQYVKTSPYR